MLDESSVDILRWGAGAEERPEDKKRTLVFLMISKGNSGSGFKVRCPRGKIQD